MPLQIRRGTTAERLSITPLVGEPVFDTTLSQIFVGNGTTAGGVSPNIDAETIEQALDTVGAALVNGTHQNISFTYGTVQDTANRIDATVSVSALLENLNLNGFDIIGNGNIDISGSIIGDVTGSVFADNSTMLVDGTNGRIVGPLATSGLVLDLNLNGYNINSLEDSNIVINPTGVGEVVIDGSLNITGNIGKTGTLQIASTGNILLEPTSVVQIGNNNTNIDGNFIITRNTHGTAPTSGFLFEQHHNVADSTNFSFYRTRGTGLSPQDVQDGDELAEILFVGQAPGSFLPAGGAAITVSVDGTPVTGHIPTKIQFGIDNGISQDFRAELNSQGVWKINKLSSLTTPEIEVQALLKGDLSGSVFADDSTLIIDGTEGGKIFTPSVTVSDFLKLPVYSNDAARSAAITSPEKGMVIMIESGTIPAATDQIQFYNGTSWVNL
jgi:hypothetical protein